MLTQARLRELLDYDPSSGFFRRRINSSNALAGSKAGGLSGVGYYQISIDGKKYYNHRLAWFYVHGRWPKAEIDHINLNKADNRLENLREATRQENKRNSARQSNNRSGLKGVGFHAGRRKWRARLARQHLGLFETPEEAHAAYREAASKRYGEFANHGE